MIIISKDRNLILIFLYNDFLYKNNTYGFLYKVSIIVTKTALFFWRIKRNGVQTPCGVKLSSQQ